MSNSTEHRRLAAIMFTDMVGYSALSQRNEALALELLEEHRQILRSVFPKHQGQEIKSTGDGFLVEFASALAAVQCAVEIQQLMRQRNAGRSTERRVLVRIGIHLGDVVRRENDVFGDGVNIAARIEPLAEPGGICVSRAVYEQIENKVDHALVQLSKPALKNIQATVEVYRLMLDETRAPQPAAGKSRSRLLLAGVVVALAAIGVVVFLKPRSGSTAALPETKAPSNTLSSASAKLPAPVATGFRVLHRFGPTNVESGNGWGPLTLASDGFLYGCTINLGSQGGGSLYRIRTNGSDHAVLHTFGGTNGGEPLGGVIEGRDGALYGTTFLGGAQGAGTVFRVAKDGGDFRVLHHFASSNDCRYPVSELLEAKDGMLYGTAQGGGGYGLGGVFRIARDGSSYAIVTGFYRGQPDDPRMPVGGLIQLPGGAFAGTTKLGGLKNNGTVYRLDAAGHLNVRSVGVVAGGAVQPEGTLCWGGDGWLYGTCTLGGPVGYGAVFRVRFDGSEFSIIRQLGITVDDAREPHTGLVEIAKGWLAGTSRLGGSANQGVIFALTTDGSSYRTLHSFTGTDGEGARLRSPLVRSSPGVFYGTTAGGGSGDLGVVFQLTVADPAQASTGTAGPASH